jgi:hypothetical protein
MVFTMRFALMFLAPRTALRRSAPLFLRRARRRSAPLSLRMTVDRERSRYD